MSETGRKVVLVTDAMAEEGLEILSNHPHIELRNKPGLPADELLKEIQDAHALMVRSGTKVRKPALEAGQILKVVGRAGTGVDNIDVEEATRRGVVVMNTPGGNSVAACEHTFALLLSLMRHVPNAAKDLAGGKWNRKLYMGRQLQGRTLGLIGFGRIGREVASRARAFGMDVLVNDPFVSEELARECDCTLATREEVFTKSDVLSLHVPLNDETRGMINQATMKTMKPGVVILNCARGGLIQEADLLAALETGQVSGVALDVFEQEPPTDTALLSHPHVVATPHLGASTEEAQRNVAAELAQQVIDFLFQGEIRNAVNMPSLSAELYESLKPHLVLAERLGSLAGQVAGGPFTELDISFRGEYLKLPRGPIVSAATLGVMRSLPGSAVANFVNARYLASESGLRIQEQASEDSGDHSGMLQIMLKNDTGLTTMSGIVTHAGDPRIVLWDGLAVDARPSGVLMAVRNEDVPGVVGFIGSTLGEAKINISQISWGRNPDSDEARTLLNLDSAPEALVLESIQKHPAIQWAKLAQFE